MVLDYVLFLLVCTYTDVNINTVDDHVTRWGSCADEIFLFQWCIIVVRRVPSDFCEDSFCVEKRMLTPPYKCRRI